MMHRFLVLLGDFSWDGYGDESWVLIMIAREGCDEERGKGDYLCPTASIPLIHNAR